MPDACGRLLVLVSLFAIMTVCRKLNSLQMTPSSHVDLESHLTNVALEQSEPGSRAETQRGGVSEKGGRGRERV